MKCWQCPIDCRFVCDRDVRAKRQMHATTYAHTIDHFVASWVCLFFFRSSRVYLAAAHLLSFCFAFDHNNSKQFISSSMRILLVVTRGNRLAIIRFTFFFCCFATRFWGFWMLVRTLKHRTVCEFASFRWIRVCCVFRLARLASHWLLVVNEMSCRRLFRIGRVVQLSVFTLDKTARILALVFESMPNDSTMTTMR